LLCDDLVSVLLEKLEDVEVFFDLRKLLLFWSLLSTIVLFGLRCKSTELFHKLNEDFLNVDVSIKLCCGLKELLQRLEVVLIWEGLNNAVH
jgi:hypothetical protein